MAALGKASHYLLNTRAAKEKKKGEKKEKKKTGTVVGNQLNAEFTRWGFL